MNYYFWPELQHQQHKLIHMHLTIISSYKRRADNHDILKANSSF